MSQACSESGGDMERMASYIRDEVSVGGRHHTEGVASP